MVLGAYVATLMLFCATSPITAEPSLAAYVRLPTIVMDVLVAGLSGRRPLIMLILPGQPVPSTHTLSCTYKMPFAGAVSVAIGLLVVLVMPLDVSFCTIYSSIVPLDFNLK